MRAKTHMFYDSYFFQLTIKPYYYYVIPKIVTDSHGFGRFIRWFCFICSLLAVSVQIGIETHILTYQLIIHTCWSATDKI